MAKIAVFCLMLLLLSMAPEAAFAVAHNAQNVACKDGTSVLTMTRKGACVDHGGNAKREAPEAAPEATAPK